MPTVDLTVSISVILAVCALVSPAITAIINNRHQYRMKQLELAHQEKMEEKAHQREIYESYIRSAGACIQRPSPEALQNYGSCSALAAYYVPDDVRPNVLLLERTMGNGPAAINLLATITGQLRNTPPK